MFFVIQRHSKDQMKQFIAYTISRYISSSSSENIIFEFKTEDGPKRKWAHKSEVILLTEDKELFEKTYDRLQQIKGVHVEQITKAQEELGAKIDAFVEEIHKEFGEIRDTCCRLCEGQKPAQ